MFEVRSKWTGSYPNLCSGDWVIHVNGKQLQGLGNSNMETIGTYQSWHFEGWNEVFEDHQDGLEFNDWCKSLPNNLEMSLRLAGFNPKDKELLKAIYISVSAEDWRSSSCGGCI